MDNVEIIKDTIATEKIQPDLRDMGYGKFEGETLCIW
jgi:hypothetical protein